MSTNSEAQIRCAVNDCLGRCLYSGSPLGTVAEFVEKLRGEGWNESDIHEVEVVVRRVLAGVMNDEHVEVDADLV